MKLIKEKEEHSPNTLISASSILSLSYSSWPAYLGSVVLLIFISQPEVSLFRAVLVKFGRWAVSHQAGGVFFSFDIIFCTHAWYWNKISRKIFSWSIILMEKLNPSFAGYENNSTDLHRCFGSTSDPVNLWISAKCVSACSSLRNAF